jgi:hypothetical protein
MSHVDTLAQFDAFVRQTRRRLEEATHSFQVQRVGDVVTATIEKLIPEAPPEDVAEDNSLYADQAVEAPAVEGTTEAAAPAEEVVTTEAPK